jgi:hypothetical protein
MPGSPGISIARNITPQMRAQGDFEDLDVRVDPYSLQHTTPQSRAMALNQIIQQTILPILPLLVRQGMMLDLSAYLRKLGEYLDMPELNEILTNREPPTQDTTISSDATGAPGMPQKTTREYIRHNMPSQTREASDRNLVATMLGHDLGGNPNGETP